MNLKLLILKRQEIKKMQPPRIENQIYSDFKSFNFTVLLYFNDKVKW